ncbi:MAG: hypothetical protein HY303_09215 [Candidatus Wallbacteria bacterium]|nr:hypothetical protein [Candidatus Wallbacteria bacterium]
MTRARLALLAFFLVATQASAQPQPGLDFPLEQLLPRVLDAAGGQRRWAGIRDVALLETRKQLEPSGHVRASEDLEIFLQNEPHINLLMVRHHRGVEIHQGWHRDSAWMVEDGLRVHDRGRIEAARRELLETLFLVRLPFCLPEEPKGKLVYEGEYLLGGRRVHQVRYPSGEYPGGNTRLYVTRNSYELAAVGYHGPAGTFQQFAFRRQVEEHGVRQPWVRELSTGGTVVRRDEVRKLKVNQWFSPDVFLPEAWLRR